MVILEFESLIKPISAKSPTGKDLRKDNSLTSNYHKIKDARVAARNIERQQIQGADKVNKADWQLVCKLACQILSKQSKDLDVAVWLTEALLREHGFAGLAEGFQLLRRLLEEFWCILYPLPDEDGIATTLAPLSGLNGEESDGTLIVPIAIVPLTQGQSTGPFALWQYQQTLKILKINDSEKKAQRIANGAITLEEIEKAATETSPLFFKELSKDLETCINEFIQLTQFLEEKCAAEAPPSSRILGQLNACIDCLKTIAKYSFPSEQVTSVAITNITETSSVHLQQEPNTLKINNNKDLSREQALQSLLQAAEFFRHTEPHSPLSYILERTVRWGRMSLPELLKELVKDEQAFGGVCNLTGINY